MTTIAIQYLFLNKYLIEPQRSSVLQSYIWLPWTPKLLYGIITDCVPIFGSTKRSYIILMGLVQGTCCLLIAFIPFSNPVFVILCACTMSMALAFMDVVVDGLMVINARLDPKAGSEEL